ncbi:DUF3043 domain-containing protein [Cellulomonas sp. SLBN-39]|uniref:DUF3043 domain-containing protein n=1 Tax=Cellulomonas sp. SLBN-39 TaxID=2768446 RepID=UPI00114F9443|nr:DUF3043 domain-containing protein [Cellulomonas sp. SLBN-39]TQL03909.1 DUF3043 family protein [Cellulomonas sp. SLBN-39]
MFGRSKTTQTTDAPVEESPTPGAPGQGKGRPTPSRKEAEARNRRPLVPTDRRAAAREERARARAQRELEYQAMRTGDERHMPPRDRGPVRRFIRDHVDSRWNLGELFLPLAAVLLVLQMVLLNTQPEIAFVILVVLYVYVLAAVVDAWFLWRGTKKRVAAKFGPDALPQGATMYTVMRAFQVRPSRLPKPQVKHGQRPS